MTVAEMNNPSSTIWLSLGRPGIDGVAPRGTASPIWRNRFATFFLAIITTVEQPTQLLGRTIGHSTGDRQLLDESEQADSQDAMSPAATPERIRKHPRFLRDCNSAIVRSVAGVLIR